MQIYRPPRPRQGRATATFRRMSTLFLNADEFLRARANAVVLKGRQPLGDQAFIGLSFSRPALSVLALRVDILKTYPAAAIRLLGALPPVEAVEMRPAPGEHGHLGGSLPALPVITLRLQAANASRFGRVRARSPLCRSSPNCAVPKITAEPHRCVSAAPRDQSATRFALNARAFSSRFRRLPGCAAVGTLLSSMVVNDLNVVGVAVPEREANAPTCVHGHRPLASPLSS